MHSAFVHLLGAISAILIAIVGVLVITVGKKRAEQVLRWCGRQAKKVLKWFWRKLWRMIRWLGRASWRGLCRRPPPRQPPGQNQENP